MTQFSIPSNHILIINRLALDTQCIIHTELDKDEIIVNVCRGDAKELVKAYLLEVKFNVKGDNSYE